MVINLTKTTIKSTVRPLGGNLFEGKIKKYFYKEIIKEKFWSLRTDGRVEKNARKTSVLWGGSTVAYISKIKHQQRILISAYNTVDPPKDGRFSSIFFDPTVRP